MPRQARVVADGVPHPITQRGNNRQEVFPLDEDRRFYLDSLRLHACRHGVQLLGYCRMSNHVHLVAAPGRPDGLARVGQPFSLLFSQSRYAGDLHGGEVLECPRVPPAIRFFKGFP
jgi:putative transposase